MVYKNKDTRNAYLAKWRKKNAKKLALQMRERRANRTSEQIEHDRQKLREWKRVNHERYREIRDRYTKNLQTRVFRLIPNECYYKNDFCNGELQWDHKYGDGKKHREVSKWRGSGKQLYLEALKYPDRWLRLCARHNLMKGNIPKDKFEAMILEMAERIKMKSYGQANPVPLKLT